MRLLNGSKGILAVALFALMNFAACQQSAETNTSNTNASEGTGNTSVSVNSSNNANMTGSTVTTNTGATIEAREPDKYSATVVVRASASGQQNAAGQTEFKVARNGSDRRYSLDTKLPTVGEIIFLDKADKRYLILPAQKKYVEMTQELTGMNIDAVRSMTPGQIVAYVEQQKGVERVGEETLNNRQVVKYKVAGRAQTQTTAGQVQGETFIYVDKETGLPLRVEGFGQSTGNVQGVSGGNLVAEMSDLKTDVDPTQFEVPQGYTKVSPEEVKQTFAQLTQLAQGVLNFINNQQKNASQPAASPAR